MPSSTVENYIKQIFLAQQEHPGLVPMGEVSQRLEVVPGTATTMIKALAESNLLTYEPRVGVRLTIAGEKLALNILRRHRLIELFLHKVLDMDWSEVHEEAEELEHAISERVLAKIDQMLDYPDYDPHGDPIPSASGDYTIIDATCLTNCPINQQQQIARLSDQEPAFLQFAQSNGLVPGAILTILERNTAAQSITLQLAGGQLITIGLAAGKNIFVHDPS